MIEFPAIMILSRLLTPAQVGVFSVAVTFLNVVHKVRDLGTSEYLVQTKELRDDVAKSAFTINFIIAWSLGALLFAASPLLATFFNEQGLGSVIRILSITFFLLPIGSTVNAILIREMQFGIRYKINISQAFAQNAVTITLAWHGFGYYSPAWGAVAGMLTTIAGCFFWASEYRIRGLGLSQWRPVTYFGVQKTAGTIMQQVGGAAPDLVIGRMLGFTAVGLFSRGNGLPRMFRQNVIAAVGQVSYSAFAQRHREGGRPMELYLSSITYITGIGWPFLGFASLMAYPLIHIFFGPQWDGAVPILRLIAITTCISLLVLNYQNLLTAIGRVGLASLWTALWQTVRVLVIICACFFSLVAVAASLIPATTLLTIAVLCGLCYVTGTSLRSYLHAIAPSAALTAAALIPAAICRSIYTPSADMLWGPTILAGTSMVAGGLLGAWLLRHPLWDEAANLLQKRFKFPYPTARR